MNALVELVMREIRKRELWPELQARLKRNDCHNPAGSGNGGQFCPGGGGTAVADSDDSTDSKPIKTIEEALKRLENGQGVEFEKPKQVVTLIHEIRKIVKEAQASGEAVKVYDLCRVSVKGTNIFCRDNMDIPRSAMPQLKGQPRKGSPADSGYPKDDQGRVDLMGEYLDHLDDKGIKVNATKIRATHLRAAQREIDGAKVAKILHKYEKEGIDKNRRFPVSKDGYIVDGHHHWAASIVYQMEYGKSDTPKFRVNEIDMKILPLLKVTKDFTTKMGIAGRAVGKGFGLDDEGILTKGNDCHQPAGSSNGGEFCSDGGDHFQVGGPSGIPEVDQARADLRDYEDTINMSVARQLGLTETDAENLHDWTMGTAEYSVAEFNKLRTSASMKKTMEKLPLYRGVVYRGIAVTEKEAEKLANQTAFSITKISSASVREDVAWDFAAQNQAGKKSVQVMMRLEAMSARNLSKVILADEEEEVVVGSTKNKWRVTKVIRPGPGHMTIHAKEIL